MHALLFCPAATSVVEVTAWPSLSFFLSYAGFGKFRVGLYYSVSQLAGFWLLYLLSIGYWHGDPAGQSAQISSRFMSSCVVQAHTWSCIVRFQRIYNNEFTDQVFSYVLLKTITDDKNGWKFTTLLQHFSPLKRLINMIFSAQISVLQVRPFVTPFLIS